MSIYLKLFETTSQYNEYINGSNIILPNISAAKGPPAVVYYNRWFAPSQRIRYTADTKLAETTDDFSDGLHTNAFNTTIKSHTFENGVGTIEFNDDVTSIGNSVFMGCSGLTSITIPDSVTSIGDSAFESCRGLTSVTIPNSVTSIGSMAFTGCSNLTSVTIGSNVTSINFMAFDNCYFVSSNFVNNSTLDAESNDYWGAIIADTDINGLLIKNNEVVKYRGTSNSVTIPNTVTSIGGSAFSGCTGLTSIVIPNSVTSIGGGAFQNCTSLTSITIPNSVTNIGYNTFYGCSGLTSITIPNNVTNIYNNAFNNCSSLRSITCNAMKAPTIKSNTFQNVRTGGTLTVPTGSTGYNVWMGTGNYYLGKYKWTKVEQ